MQKLDKKKLSPMYRSRLEKKLKPAKRAWRSFTSKLRRLDIPKTIKTTTHRLLTFCSQRLFMPFKQRFLTKPASRRRQYPHLYQYNHQNQLLQKNFAAIYVDHFYQEPLQPQPPPPSSLHGKHFFHAAETSTRSSTKEVAPEVKESGVSSIEDAWEAIVAKSPQLRVDERAEEFINKFREDMKIQRERSLLEYQEMLARGS